MLGVCGDDARPAASTALLAAAGQGGNVDAQPMKVVVASRPRFKRPALALAVPRADHA